MRTSAELVSYNTILCSCKNSLIYNCKTTQIGLTDHLPAEVPEDVAVNEEFLQKLHHVLMEVEVVEGVLECPETGRIFPIQNGIPNMLLGENEV